MLTQVEAAKLTVDDLRRGVIETIIYDSVLLQNLQFLPVRGSAHKYVRESTLPSMRWHVPHDAWTEGTGTNTEHTAGLKTVGDNVEIDNFIAQTMDTQDLTTLQVQAKLKALGVSAEDKFINGDETTNPEEPDGIVNLLDASMKVNGGNNALDLEEMDELLDTTLMPNDLIILSRKKRRKITQLRRALGCYTEGIDAFGKKVQTYDAVPLSVSNVVAEDDTAPATNIIYVARFGPEALMGLQNGSIETTFLGEMQAKNAKLYRVHWYCGIALFNIYGLAGLYGVTNA